MRGVDRGMLAASAVVVVAVVVAAVAAWPKQENVEPRDETAALVLAS